MRHGWLLLTEIQFFGIRCAEAAVLAQIETGFLLGWGGGFGEAWAVSRGGLVVNHAFEDAGGVRISEGLAYVLICRSFGTVLRA